MKETTLITNAETAVEAVENATYAGIPEAAMQAIKAMPIEGRVADLQAKGKLPKNYPAVMTVTEKGSISFKSTLSKGLITSAVLVELFKSSSLTPEKLAELAEMATEASSIKYNYMEIFTEPVVEEEVAEPEEVTETTEDIV